MTNAAKLDWHDIFEVKEGMPSDLVDALDTYFAPFAAPARTDDGKNTALCIECKKPLTGLSSFFFGGGFKWGLAHGEGNCAGCGWPARGHHYIKDKDGADLLTLRDFPIQYHPDFVAAKAITAPTEEKAL